MWLPQCSAPIFPLPSKALGPRSTQTPLHTDPATHRPRDTRGPSRPRLDRLQFAKEAKKQQELQHTQEQPPALQGFPIKRQDGTCVHPEAEGGGLPVVGPPQETLVAPLPSGFLVPDGKGGEGMSRRPLVDAGGLTKL